MAAKDRLNPMNYDDSFQLIGYDYLIDEDMKVWLIEVNDHPYLGIANQYIAGVMPKMLDDMFKLTLDIHYSTKDTTDIENGF